MNRIWIKTLVILIITSLFMGLTGCQNSESQTVKEKTPLREYTPYTVPEYEMPESLISEDDYRQAYMCVTMKALQGGGTYNDIPLLAMSSARMEEELKENGYPVTIEGYRVVTKGDDYLFEASKALGTDEDYISGIWLQFFGMDDNDFDWTSFNKLNAETSLGISQEIFGKSPYDLFETLGINDDMLNWLALKKDMSTFWYDDDRQYWYVAYSQDSSVTNGGDTKYKFTLYLSRGALDVEESVFIAFDPYHILTVEYKIDYTPEAQIARRDADYNEWLVSEGK